MTDITARLADALPERLVADSALDFNQAHVHITEAKPCPFCGFQPTIQPWHGGGKMKRLIGCSNEACQVQPSVCGSRRDTAVAAWNTRQSALAAYESERVGWQPIETAPKNECVLVLAHKQQFVAWLQDDATDPWLCGAGEESGLDGMWCVTDNKLGPFPLRGGRPTHWMPLPAAPVTP